MLSGPVVMTEPMASGRGKSDRPETRIETLDPFGVLPAARAREPECHGPIVPIASCIARRTALAIWREERRSDVGALSPRGELQVDRDPHIAVLAC